MCKTLHTSIQFSYDLTWKEQTELIMCKTLHTSIQFSYDLTWNWTNHVQAPTYIHLYSLAMTVYGCVYSY
jgi:Fe2+ or Zn2+ uptake regulation protein